MTITMYGADWCDDYRRAEKFFVDNNIDFQKVDVELNIRHWATKGLNKRNIFSS